MPEFSVYEKRAYGRVLRYPATPKGRTALNLLRGNHRDDTHTTVTPGIEEALGLLGFTIRTVDAPKED